MENEHLLVAVAPCYGGRVVDLVDKTSGRNWVAQGRLSQNTGEDTTYLAEEAVGWDECFPTVAPWDASDTVWARPLRDHGDVWGRPWDIIHSSHTELCLGYVDPQFALLRRLLLDGPRLVVEYNLDNRSGSSLPYLWALHALLAVTEIDRIVLSNVEAVAVTHLSRDRVAFQERTLTWPGPNLSWPEPLDRVQPVSANLAAKLYATNIAGGSVTVGNGQQWLRFAWSETIQDLGIWLNYGGWPQPGGTHHIALEPTSAPVDHLGQALDRPVPTILAAGESRSWTVTISVGANL